MSRVSSVEPESTTSTGARPPTEAIALPMFIRSSSERMMTARSCMASLDRLDQHAEPQPPTETLHECAWIDLPDELCEPTLVLLARPHREQITGEQRRVDVDAREVPQQIAGFLVGVRLGAGALEVL